MLLIPTRDGYKNYLKQSYGRFSLAIWNENKINTAVKPDLFKINSKVHYLQNYAPNDTLQTDER